jgi:zinc protease
VAHKVVKVAAEPTLLQVAPMSCRQRTLANGLQVISQAGGGGGSATVQVWYRVGGKDDPEGRSGFAHLFEHLMFKSTRYLAAEQFDRLTENVGGENNAFTAEDVTAYHATVPAHHLERLLWAEAERMSNLNVDEANFKSERAVVQEEYRQRVLANPYGLLFNGIAPNAYIKHPYRRPVIGSIADLDAATLDDVRAFHATYYRPDNAVLIVTGDFDPTELDRWVDRYFGPLKAPATPVPRVTVQEPHRTQAVQVALTGPNVPLPAVLQIWQGPPASSPDAAVLDVAQALLAGGNSSRLNEALVYRQRVAAQAGFEAELHTDTGAVMAYAIASGPSTPQSLIAPLTAEIRRLATRPILPAELDKVKTQLLTAALNSRQTALGRGTALGWAMIYANDPDEVNRELRALQAVTAADVQRVLRDYVLNRPAVTLTYTQARQAPQARPAAPAAAAASTPEVKP